MTVVFVHKRAQELQIHSRWCILGVYERVISMTIKARRVGNSITLTIPKSIKIADGTEFTVEQRDDGGILYLPKHRNPFEGDWYKQQVHQQDITLENEVLPSEWD